MTIERWSPFRELESMRREMDRVWEELFPASRRAVMESPLVKPFMQKGTVSPAIDIIDKGSEVVVKADMPGAEKDKIEISMQENTLTIKGEVKTEAEVKEDQYYYSERGYKAYSRSVHIPFKIDADKIKAAFKNGILTVHLPKAEEIQPKKIKVEVA